MLEIFEEHVGPLLGEAFHDINAQVTDLDVWYWKNYD